MYARTPSRPFEEPAVGTVHTYGLIPANPREPKCGEVQGSKPTAFAEGLLGSGVVVLTIRMDTDLLLGWIVPTIPVCKTYFSRDRRDIPYVKPTLP